jgi:uncharacterized protein YjbJ (UPF0337 family)
MVPIAARGTNGPMVPKSALWHASCEASLEVTTAGFRPRAVQGRLTMDRDRVEGTIKEGAGKVQEEWGDATNDPRAEEEGQDRQAEGDLQQKWGEAKDAARDVADEVDEKV